MRLLILVVVTGFTSLSAQAAERCVPDDWEASEETKRILRIADDEQRRAALEAHKSAIGSGLAAKYQFRICGAGASVEFASFTRTLERYRGKADGLEWVTLTPAEAAYFIDCDDNKNPFFNNTEIDNLKYSSAGLSDNTLQMIRSMGPLLLEPGPNGQTPLEYIQDRLEYSSLSDSPIYGVYARIKARILMEHDYLSERCPTE